MNHYKPRVLLFLLLICATTIAFKPITKTGESDPSIFSSKRDTTAIDIPIAGNSWVVSNAPDNKTGNTSFNKMLSKSGISNWTNGNMEVNTYVRFAKAGKIQLWLNAAAKDGKSTLIITSNGRSKTLIIEDSNPKLYDAGEWLIKESGYIKFTIRGISKRGTTYADINSLKLSGSAITTETAYVKNNEGNYFYWGRRGPSVHLGYQMPENTNAEWFYNEVTVPIGEDKQGSYFMANGFAEGYFGMQVNSPTERRILFSTWSPFSTDDPKSIPADMKITLLKKGENVHTGEFGNEGSGGQSYLKYNWTAGNTYRFLLHGYPDGNNNTIYTAYFYAPELDKWMLIASFKRPKTNTYLKRLHSFLENFDPEQGDKERRVLFNNQWIRNAEGKWIELTKAKFTGDATAGKGFRKDYAGGIENGSFFLKNCGFFKNTVQLNSLFERTPNNKQPNVDINTLP